ncbi:MAG: hypothetical protein M1831_002818 [Alyxoria varia]|nr:MAG: hypothetical protein M1831_002818 [Alyxoria varia]
MPSSLFAIAALAMAQSSAAVYAAPTAERLVPPLARRQTAPSGVPQFVLDHVHLHSQDPYLPNPPSTHLTHVSPTINTDPVSPSLLPPDGLTLSNLAVLNDLPDSNGGQDVYLTANDDFTQLPEWLRGERPDGNGGIPGACVVVVNEKREDVVDAFYFYFCSYNQGNTVLGRELGDHLGDWEHNAIRFESGVPQSVWYSAHANGGAFEWDAAPKEGTNNDRLTVYSANGTHANYATPGTHDHTIPNVPLPEGPLEDVTDDAGSVWDPLRGASFYRVTFPEGTEDGDSSAPRFEGYGGEVTPTGFLEFTGKWGDEELVEEDERQEEFFGVKKYASGPTGPRDKQLNREKICPDNGVLCVVRGVVGPGS